MGRGRGCALRWRVCQGGGSVGVEGENGRVEEGWMEPSSVGSDVKFCGHQRRQATL